MGTYRVKLGKSLSKEELSLLLAIGAKDCKEFYFMDEPLTGQVRGWEEGDTLSWYDDFKTEEQFLQNIGYSSVRVEEEMKSDDWKCFLIDKHLPPGEKK